MDPDLPAEDESPELDQEPSDERMTEQHPADAIEPAGGDPACWAHRPSENGY